MIFGVCMSVVNMLHFRRPAMILLEFLPQVNEYGHRLTIIRIMPIIFSFSTLQILFLILLFAYMVFMMFVKFFLFSAKYTDFKYSPGCAPSILNLFINMMLFKNTPPPNHCDEFMFEGQGQIQSVFIILGLLCIPWMLLGKPLYILCTRKPGSHVISIGI